MGERVLARVHFRIIVREREIRRILLGDDALAVTSHSRSLSSGET